MDYPKSILNAVKQAVENNPTSVVDSVEEADRLIEQSPDLEKFLSMVRRQTIETLVYQQRHYFNVKVRKNSKNSYTQPKVNILSSKAIESAYEEVFAYRVGGTILGEITGEQLAPLANMEAQRATGHKFNATLLSWLADRVPATKKVRESISGKELKAVFSKLQEQVYGDLEVANQVDDQ